jgi:hypothetical protein
VDSGCIGHLLLIYAPRSNKTKYINPLIVRLPNQFQSENYEMKDTLSLLKLMALPFSTELERKS